EGRRRVLEREQPQLDGLRPPRQRLPGGVHADGRPSAVGRMSLPKPVAVSGALLGGALVAWIVTYQRMHGIDAGPGSDFGGLGWYLGLWVTMMAAMMLPSVAPMVLVFSRVNRERARRGSAGAAPTWVFVVGYLIAWTVYGLVAYGLYRVAKEAAPHFLGWNRGGRSHAGRGLALHGRVPLAPPQEAGALR